MDVALMKKTEELAKELAQNSPTLEELNTVMRSLMKSAMERMLNTEMDVHLGRRSTSLAETDDTAEITDQTAFEANTAAASSKSRNRRNGVSAKTIQGESGKLAISVPRDRDGTFEPIVKTNRTAQTPSQSRACDAQPAPKSAPQECPQKAHPPSQVRCRGISHSPTPCRKRRRNRARRWPVQSVVSCEVRRASSSISLSTPQR